jgi:hypothetical protein
MSNIAASTWLPKGGMELHPPSDEYRIIELELVPHPDQSRPEMTEMDYSMLGGMPRMKLRAATTWYILRKWSVDCSPDHSLRGPEYRLWLKDHLAIYGVRSAVLAPGAVLANEEQTNAKASIDD